MVSACSPCAAVRWRGYERRCAGAAAGAQPCASALAPLPSPLRPSVAGAPLAAGACVHALRRLRPSPGPGLAHPWQRRCAGCAPEALASVLAARCSVTSLPW